MQLVTLHLESEGSDRCRRSCLLFVFQSNVSACAVRACLCVGLHVHVWSPEVDAGNLPLIH